MTSRSLVRLLRLLSICIVIVVVVATTATAASPGASPACTHGVSSVGPVTLTNGDLSGDTTPVIEACLP